MLSYTSAAASPPTSAARHRLPARNSTRRPAFSGGPAPIPGKVMAKAAGAYSGVRSSALLFWGLGTMASVALNLALLPLCKDGLSIGGASVTTEGGEFLAKAASYAAEKLGYAAVEAAKAEQQEVEVRTTSGSHPISKDSIINLDHGDPTMFESFWRGVGDKGDIMIPGWQAMSYFSDASKLCWFLEPEFAKEIVRLHRLVGNAVAEDRHIIVGTGSTQLFQAVLYALSPADAPQPMSVVSAVPYYSSYPAVTDFLRSGLFRWAGNANTFKGDKYIELVCSPNNPDGSVREAVLNSESGKIVHDLAYYWPQYTPITSPADHEIMLFTFSKATGHAGTRLGWAIVKDLEVAKRMIKFIELNTIGVSKDSQVRAAKILKVISDGYERPEAVEAHKLFDYGRRLMSRRWERLREVVNSSGIFSLPEFPSGICKFTSEKTGTYPAFAWLKCQKKGVDDCEVFLRSHKILTRSGRHFGGEPTYVRVSMLDRDETFSLFIERLSSIV